MGALPDAVPLDAARPVLQPLRHGAPQLLRRIAVLVPLKGCGRQLAEWQVGRWCRLPGGEVLCPAVPAVPPRSVASFPLEQWEEAMKLA